MKIYALEFTNFRGIKKLNLNLEGKSTVFFGINGVGKSSILKGINLIFSKIINKMVKSRYKQGITIKLSDISNDAVECMINAKISFPDGQINEYSRSMDRKAKGRTNITLFPESFYKNYEQNYFDTDTDIPIFVNYGVNRLVLDDPVRIRAKLIFDREAAFEKAIESRIDFRTFFEWFRYQEDYENQQKVREKINHEDSQLKAVRHAILKMFDGFSDLRIERQSLSMKVNKGATVLSVEQLSDGEKCTIVLIGDLARRLSLANPYKKNPLHGEGVVLIDEIELHMHPTWQREILPKLKDTFPNIQFIITTHSPQVLGEIGDDFSVYSLTNNNGELEYSKIGPLIGWDTNYILEDFMGASSLNLQTKEMINSMYEDYKNGEYNSAKEKAKKLEAMTNSIHEDVVKINILLERIENKR